MKFIKKPIRQYFTRKRFVRISLLLIGLPLVFLLIANYKVESVSEPYVTSVIDSLPEVDVAIVPGTAFGKTSTDYVRFSFAASKENIQKALEKIKKMLE